MTPLQINGSHVKLIGDVDFSTSHTFLPTLTEVLVTYNLIELDMSAVTYIDSSGLGLIVSLTKKAKVLGLYPDEVVILTNVSRPIRRVLDMSGIIALIKVKGE